MVFGFRYASYNEPCFGWVGMVTKEWPRALHLFLPPFKQVLDLTTIGALSANHGCWLAVVSAVG